MHYCIEAYQESRHSTFGRKVMKTGVKVTPSGVMFFYAIVDSIVLFDFCRVSECVCLN
jgi:hypothetical protein